MTTLTETIAILLELLADKPKLRPRWRDAVKHAAEALEGHEAELAALIEDLDARGETMVRQDEALEEAEKVIGPFSGCVDDDGNLRPYPSFKHWMAAREWQRKYGKQGQ